MTMVKELFAKYGSRLTSGTSEILYDALLEDDALAPFFVHVDMDVLREHMADFISSITGGPEIYQGKPMDVAHAPFAITTHHYKAVATHLRSALVRAGISEEDTNMLMHEVSQLEASIVNRAS